MRSNSIPRTHTRTLRSGVLLTALSAFGLVGVQCPGVQQHALVGVCQRDITPISASLVDEYETAFGGTAVVNHSDPVFMAGFGNDRQATGYNDRLWARGVVVDGAGGQVTFRELGRIAYSNQSKIPEDLEAGLETVNYYKFPHAEPFMTPDESGRVRAQFSFSAAPSSSLPSSPMSGSRSRPSPTTA